MKFWKFLNVSNSTLLLQKKIEDERNCIMKTEGPYVKVILWNEVIKHPLLKPNLEIGRFCHLF
jgi:hypothetical protein